jgi:hypothetical protein
VSTVYRPAGIGRILDRAIGLYRANWRPIALAALIALFPVALLASLGQVFAQRELLGMIQAVISQDPLRFVAVSQDAQRNQIINLLGTAAVWLFAVVRLWMTVGVLTVAPKLVAGQSVTVRELLTAPASHFWVALAVTIVGGVVAAIPVVGWIVAVFWTVAVAVVVVEGAPFEKSFGRSWKLIANVGFWRTVAFLIGLGLVTLALQLVPTAPMVLRQALDWLRDTGAIFQPMSVEWTVVSGVLGALGNALAAPFAMLATYLYYTDARARAEGMDLVMRARAMEQPA